MEQSAPGAAREGGHPFIEVTGDGQRLRFRSSAMRDAVFAAGRALDLADAIIAHDLLRRDAADIPYIREALEKSGARLVAEEVPACPCGPSGPAVEKTRTYQHFNNGCGDRVSIGLNEGVIEIFVRSDAGGVKLLVPSERRVAPGVVLNAEKLRELCEPTPTERCAPDCDGECGECPFTRDPEKLLSQIAQLRREKGTLVAVVQQHADVIARTAQANRVLLREKGEAIRERDELKDQCHVEAVEHRLVVKRVAARNEEVMRQNAEVAEENRILARRVEDLQSEIRALETAKQLLREQCDILSADRDRAEELWRRQVRALNQEQAVQCAPMKGRFLGDTSPDEAPAVLEECSGAAELPARLKIGAYAVRVFSDLERLTEARVRLQNLDLIGNLSQQQCEIDVDPTLPPDMHRETLLHEVLHGCFLAAGALGDEETFTQEQCIVRISPVLYQVLRENPELVRFLTA